jgi:biotin-(acetyl-CoA carboxylase) ligase
VEAVGMTKRFPTFESTSASGRKPESEVDKKDKLNLLLLNAVDETLKRVFKKPGAEAIYKYIENDCHLKREEIAEKTNVFCAGLERMLGSGALVIEKLILKNLHRKLNLKFREKKSCEFAYYVKKLRKMHGC